MKKAFLALALLGSPAMAGELTSIHSVQTQLSVDALSVQNTRNASTASISGENLTVVDMPQIGAVGPGSATLVTPAAGVSIASAGSPFSYSQSAFVGSDASAMTPTVAAGVVTALGAADQQTVTTGGTTGALAGTNLGTGVATITAGGAGTDAVIIRSNTLSVFN